MSFTTSRIGKICIFLLILIPLIAIFRINNQYFLYFMILYWIIFVLVGLLYLLFFKDKIKKKDRTTVEIKENKFSGLTEKLLKKGFLGHLVLFVVFFVVAALSFIGGQIFVLFTISRPLNLVSPGGQKILFDIILSITISIIITLKQIKKFKKMEEIQKEQ